MIHIAKKEVLSRSLIFSGLSEEELEALSRAAEERHFPAGEFIFWEGDQPDWFYVLGEGRLKVVKHTTQGKEFIITFFGPGEMFGEVAVLEEKPYPATAQAVEDCTVLAIGKESLEAFISSNPVVALKIIGVLGQRLREAQGRLKDLAGERVEQRLARIMLMLSAKIGKTLPFTRQEIADMAGMTTETAIRVLSRLAGSHVIRAERGQIVILDETKLRLLGEGPPQV